MKEALWRALAAVLSQPVIAKHIIRRAQRTPYTHLPGYMNRWWLFNPYQKQDGEIIRRRGLRAWLPSVRVHEILRADTAEHMHDHPWDARTIILRGAYTETVAGEEWNPAFFRSAGDTRAIRYGEYHHIHHVFGNSCFTLFFTWKYVGAWGFKVDGRKVPWREYLAEHPERE